MKHQPLRATLHSCSDSWSEESPWHTTRSGSSSSPEELLDDFFEDAEDDLASLGMAVEVRTCEYRALRSFNSNNKELCVELYDVQPRISDNADLRLGPKLSNVLGKCDSFHMYTG